MTIQTYSNQLISRWQSALYKILDQAALEQGENTLDALGSDHPAMVATCAACDELQQVMEGWNERPRQRVRSPLSESVEGTHDPQPSKDHGAGK